MRIGMAQGCVPCGTTERARLFTVDILRSLTAAPSSCRPPGVGGRRSGRRRGGGDAQPGRQGTRPSGIPPSGRWGILASWRGITSLRPRVKVRRGYREGLIRLSIFTPSIGHHLCQWDSRWLPFRDRELGTAFSQEVLEHFGDDGIRQMLRE